MKALRILLAATVMAAGVDPALAQDAGHGKLAFDVKQFATEVELKPKVEAQLASGGIEWGMSADQLIITLVNKRFLTADISNFTRYGELKEFELPAGEYKITCVGIIPETAFSVEKMLSKSAYFNLDRLSFPVEAGKTTVLEIHPVMRKHNTLFLKFFQPEILVKVVADGEIRSEAVVNARTEGSIAWDDYKGPLKFEASRGTVQ